MYTSIAYREWRVLWFKISRLVFQGLPSIVTGNFNCIVRSYKKIGGRQNADSIESRKFREFMDDTCLINLGYSGP